MCEIQLNKTYKWAMNCEYEKYKKSCVCKEISQFPSPVCREGSPQAAGSMRGGKGTSHESSRHRFSGVMQQQGLHGSAVTGQHPPLYGGKGVPVPAIWENINTDERKCAERASESRLDVECMKGEAVCGLLWVKIPLCFINGMYWCAIYIILINLWPNCSSHFF